MPCVAYVTQNGAPSSPTSGDDEGYYVAYKLLGSKVIKPSKTLIKILNAKKYIELNKHQGTKN